MSHRAITLLRTLLLLLPGATLACGGDDLVLPAEGEPANIEAAEGDGQTGTVGAALPESLVARVTDTRDRPVVGQRVAFVVVSAGGDVSPDTATTDADGRAATRWVLGTTAGRQSVVARVIATGASAGLEATFNATAGAGAATEIEQVSGDGQSATAGSILADSLVVLVKDAFGNPVPGHAVDWSATGGGAVSAATVTTGADGRAAVRWTLGSSAGAQTATAGSAGLEGSPVTFSATATSGAAGRLEIVTQPSGTAQSGVAFAQQPAVQLLDPNGNPVLQAGVAVSVAIATGPPGSSLLGSTTAATNANGLATFSGLGLTGPAGTYTLNFTGANLSGVTSSGVTIRAGAPAKLALATPPSGTVQSGVPFPQQPRVQVQDAAGNPVPQGGITVTASIASGAGALGGTTTATTDAGGLAAFQDLVIAGAVGTRTLIFAASGLQSVTSGPIDVRAGPPSAARSTVTANPTTIAAVTGSSTITVTVVDAQGNPVSGASVTLSASGSGNTITQPGPTNASGVTTGTFSSSTPGTKTITARAGSVTLNQTATVTVTAGAPANVTIVGGDNQTDTVGTTLPSPYVVRVTDANGIPVAGATVNWTVTGGGGSIAPASSTTDANGEASATRTLGTTAGTQTAQASVSGGGSATFTATAVPASAQAGNSTATVPPTGTVGTPTTITIQVRDQYDNLTTAGSDPQVTVSGANAGAAVSLTDNGDGTWTATYTPANAGTDTIDITIGGTHIQGSPFTSDVT